MMMPDDQRAALVVTDVKLRIVEHGSAGLLAWASCVISGAVKLDNIGVRRSNRGLFLTFPRKETAGGEKHPYFHPVNQETAQALQDAILARLAALAEAAAASRAEPK